MRLLATQWLAALHHPLYFLAHCPLPYCHLPCYPDALYLRVPYLPVLHLPVLVLTVLYLRVPYLGHPCNPAALRTQNHPFFILSIKSKGRGV